MAPFKAATDSRGGFQAFSWSSEPPRGVPTFRPFPDPTNRLVRAVAADAEADDLTDGAFLRPTGG